MTAKSTPQTAHTPTPWHKSSRRGTLEIIGDNHLSVEGNPVVTAVATMYLNATSGDISAANADFIVRAVNHHEDLATALTDGEAELLNAFNHSFDPKHVARLFTWMQSARAVLAQVEP